ncbi:hypothetical protein TNIN_93521 [Trichonephila inaurata madagascariensis]|uniref:Uncharacterized protein n=1 Tax=Trichonephila inaurata madagascariensis TaxID=2747483 RepID=A0A8X6WUX1_9ARAC|nr:hypothetical protein TNIN_93521 [Trichonephila inaurata madagascariensis]
MRISFLERVVEQVHEGKYADNCRRFHFTGLCSPYIGNEHPLSSPISPSTFLASHGYCVAKIKELDYYLCFQYATFLLSSGDFSNSSGSQSVRQGKRNGLQ